MRVLLALCLFFYALAAPGAADENARVTYGELNQRQRIGVIQNLVTQGDLKKAQFLLSGSRFDENEAGYMAAYLQAVLWHRQRRLEDAENLLRRILVERPAYDRVRLELASVLAARGNGQAAAYHLRLLADSASDQGSRQRFEGFIDRIRPEKPFTYGGFVTIAPNSNINNGSSGDTIFLGGLPFTIDPGGRAKSGLGLRAGAHAAFVHRLDEHVALYAAGSTVLSKYSDRRFDTLTGDLRLGVRHSGLAHLVGAELILDRRLISWKPVDHGVGARLFVRKPLAPKLLFSGELQFIERRYDRAAAFHSNTVSGHARLDYAYAAAGTFYGKIGGVSERVKLLPHFSYKGVDVEIGTFRQLPYGVNAGLSVDAGVNVYRADFPGIAEARQDRYVEIRGTFLKSDLALFGFAPRLGVSYRRQKSNVALYEFDKYGADLTFTKEF